VGPKPPEEVRNFCAAADVLVMPSIATASFREPWGLVANEAMNQATPVIATDAVGAAAGGLVRHERNGLVVPAGDASALAAAIRRMHDDPGLRTRLGAAARRDVQAYTFNAWASGMAAALASVGTSKEA
jgi:glycosyltransferase involved in cell wall biosynthesis